MPVARPVGSTAALVGLVTLAAVVLAACSGEATPQTAPSPTAGPSPTAAAQDQDDRQEVAFGDLLLQIPPQWQVHELSYQQEPLGGGPEAGGDWLLLQTDPDRTCDLSAGVTPGTDFGCPHVMVLGPGSIAVGHGLGPLTEDNPFALGTNPGPCPVGIAAELAAPDQPGVPDVAREALVGEITVPYREWRLACLDDPAGFELSYHWQRTWYLPDALIVDNWQTDGLEELLATSGPG